MKPATARHRGWYGPRRLVKAGHDSRHPERIYHAHRAGIFRRLVDAERVNELDAEHWISRWEREAEASGHGRDDHYWSDAWDWIAEGRRAK